MCFNQYMHVCIYESIEIQLSHNYFSFQMKNFWTEWIKYRSERNVLQCVCPSVCLSLLWGLWESVLMLHNHHWSGLALSPWIRITDQNFSIKRCQATLTLSVYFSGTGRLGSREIKGLWCDSVYMLFVLCIVNCIFMHRYNVYLLVWAYLYVFR